MAVITLKEKTINTVGNLPAVGSKAPDFVLIKNDLNEVSLNEYSGQKLVLNIFPSIDTGVCATSVRNFNQLAANLDNTKVLCISRDLPFAFKRFCGAEGIENVDTLSDFNTGKFGKDYQLEMIDGPLKYLHSRAIVVLDEKGVVVHSEQVDDISHEPNYNAALAALKNG